MTIDLPQPHGGISSYELSPPLRLDRPPGPPRSRDVFAAAHVVPEPGPRSSAQIDWEGTLAFRRHLWQYGFGVAEAMDTAQRGAGLGWMASQELIRRSTAECRALGGKIVAGASTDQLAEEGEPSLDDVRHAFEEQSAYIEGEGAQVVLMASRALARSARSSDDYRLVYRDVLRQLQRPAIIHWLGDAFDPLLRGYWGETDLDLAIDKLLELVVENRRHIAGIKLSILDAEREVVMRRQLPPDVRLYTGDDFNYMELVKGDEQGHSDALLGVFDAIAPVAASALQALDGKDYATYERLLTPTVPLARLLFSEPTYHYKTGLVFLAYLNGHQDEFKLLGGMETARPVSHLAEIVRLADIAGLLQDPERAAQRANIVFAAAGIEGRV